MNSRWLTLRMNMVRPWCMLVSEVSLSMILYTHVDDSTRQSPMWHSITCLETHINEGTNHQPFSLVLLSTQPPQNNFAWSTHITLKVLKIDKFFPNSLLASDSTNNIFECMIFYLFLLGVQWGKIGRNSTKTEKYASKHISH